MRTLLRRYFTDWFLLGMLGMIGLALACPHLGASGGWLRLDLLTNVGIFIVFFFHGLGLGWEQMRHGLARWKLPLLVQTTTFLFFPILAFCLNGIFIFWLPPTLALGFFFLCALPSTISSSVAMTATARGNVSGALFNATVSSLLGIVLTPLWLSLVTHATAHAFAFGPTLVKLSIVLVLPIILGLIIHPLIGERALRWKPFTSRMDRGIILMLVLNAFSDSVQSGLLFSVSVLALVAIAVGSSVLLTLALLFTTSAARLLRLSREDEAAAVFCGSKKSLAQGIPMAKILFGGNPALGLIVLPIMVYHQIQLLVCSILADRYARRTT